MDLRDTVPDMLSGDWKRRCKAEYQQTLTRVKRLQEMLRKRKEGKLDFEPSCPEPLLERQLVYMMEYMSILQQRAYIEGFSLED